MRPRERVIRLRKWFRLVPTPNGLRKLLIRCGRLNLLLLLRNLLLASQIRLNLRLHSPHRLPVLPVAPEADLGLLLAHFLHLF